MVRTLPYLGFLVVMAALFAVTIPANAAPPRCGTPIARAGAHGPIAGPIQFRGLRAAAASASKVLLWVREPTRGEVVVTGARCADGTRIRFWYGDKPGLPETITSTTGDLSFALHGTVGSNHPGYILWSKAGNWKLTVWRGGEPVGTLTFCVSEAALTTAPCA